MTTVEQIAQLLRQARDPSHHSDPEYYERKAETFDAIAAEQSHLAGDARTFASRARARAAELRAKAVRS